MEMERNGESGTGLAEKRSKARRGVVGGPRASGVGRRLQGDSHQKYGASDTQYKYLGRPADLATVALCLLPMAYS